jgi:hypothetical protein
LAWKLQQCSQFALLNSDDAILDVIADPGDTGFGEAEFLYAESDASETSSLKIAQTPATCAGSKSSTSLTVLVMDAKAASARRLYSSPELQRPMDARKNLLRHYGVMNVEMLAGGVEGDLIVTIYGVETGEEATFTVNFSHRVPRRSSWVLRPLTNLFKRVWSTLNRSLPHGLRITTIGVAQSNCSLTGTIIFFFTRSSSLHITSAR